MFIIKLLQTGKDCTWYSAPINFRTPVVSYTNDLPEILIGNATQIFVADDNRDVNTNSNIVDFQSNIKAVLEQLNCLIWTYYHQSLTKLILCILKQKKNTHNLDAVIEYDTPPRYHYFGVVAGLVVK
jgi:hypothetical protein